MIDNYTLYYARQAEGTHHGGFGVRGQKGAGLGSFLASTFRKIFPLIKSGARALGSEALSAGFNVLRDVINGKPLKDTVGERVNQAGQNLSRKAADTMKTMVGSGLKKRGRKRKRQSVVSSKKKRSSRKIVKRRRKTGKKNKRARVLDIFT